MFSETCNHFGNPIGGIPQLHDSEESFFFFFNLGNVFKTENAQAISCASR